MNVQNHLIKPKMSISKHAIRTLARNPKLSVITATYNDGLYIKEAIDSILNQTFSDFEYIIVDDGSTDCTSEILSSIRDKRITVIRNETKEGPGAARNRALEQARGEYIAIMDGDDISHPKRFEIQMNYLKANPNISYLGTGVKKIDKENGKFIQNDIKPLTEGSIRWMLLYKSPITHPTSIGRRDLISRVGNYNEQLLRSQDVDLMRKILKEGVLANIPDILYTYRVRSGVSHNKMVYFGKPYVKQVHLTYMKDLLGGKYDQAKLEYIWSMRYPIQDDLPETNVDEFLFNAVAVLFALYIEFQSQYHLSNDDLKYIQKDLLIWISKLSNKSENYTSLLEIFLVAENLTNLRPSNALVKAWIRSLFHQRYFFTRRI